MEKVENGQIITLGEDLNYGSLENQINDNMYGIAFNGIHIGEITSEEFKKQFIDYMEQKGFVNDDRDIVIPSGSSVTIQNLIFKGYYIKECSIALDKIEVTLYEINFVKEKDEEQFGICEILIQ